MTDRIDINRVLMQMRSLQAEMQSKVGTPLPGATPPDAKPDAPSFGDMLKGAVNKVNETQMHAGDLARRFEVGEPGVDLPEVMVAVQKASVSFQAMTQVRNKLVQAYQDIMNMPV